MGDFGLRHFHRVDEAVAAGRRGMIAALPALRSAIVARPSARDPLAGREVVLRLDPVCDMIVNPRRAAATVEGNGRTIYFCSVGCRDTFVRNGGTCGDAIV
jgi:YHS domain-containing protein